MARPGLTEWQEIDSKIGISIHNMSQSDDDIVAMSHVPHDFECTSEIWLHQVPLSDRHSSSTRNNIKLSLRHLTKGRKLYCFLIRHIDVPAQAGLNPSLARKTLNKD